MLQHARVATAQHGHTGWVLPLSALCPALQNRGDAARAKDELNDVMLHDNELHIGWGKSIPIPAQPMFVLAGHGGSQLTQPKGAAIAPPGFMASNWDLPPPGEEYVGECMHK